VEGAEKPYDLVFSESFHRGWKIYPEIKETGNWKLETGNNKINTKEKIWGVLGSVGRNIAGLFLKDKGYGEEAASYFDGEIKEGTHRMTFLEPATFETWGLKPIADDKHYLVNGYANSWHIEPADVGGVENYELVVEFWPQRLFYVGLFISAVTLLTCLIYLGFKSVRHRKRNLMIDGNLKKV
jgi:hypothetical protein